MKRSQMVKLIEKVLLRHSSDFGDAEVSNYSGLATDILNEVEEAGMKPPVEDTCPVLFTSKFVWEDEEDKPNGHKL